MGLGIKPSPPMTGRPSPARSNSSPKKVHSTIPFQKAESTTMATVLQELDHDYRKSPLQEAINKPKRRIITQSSTALTGFDMSARSKRPYLRQDSNDSHGSLQSFDSGEDDLPIQAPLFAEDDVNPFKVRDGVESHIVAEMNVATSKLVAEKVRNCQVLS
jgi:hypothetical protein